MQLITDLLPVVTNTVTEVTIAADGSGGEGQYIKLIFLLSGPAFYFFMWSRYRNARARHQHEKETEAQIVNVIGDDKKIRHIRGTSASSMADANHRAVRGARN